MILDILSVLFFVFGFALILWMVRERRRDVLHGPYVTKSGRARGDVRDGRLHRMPDRECPSEMPSSMSNVADELTRVVRDIERDTNSSGEPNAKGKWRTLTAMEYPQ
jgi:hypothetical protein